MHIETYVIHVVDDGKPVHKSLAFHLIMMGFTIRCTSTRRAFRVRGLRAGAGDLLVVGRQNAGERIAAFLPEMSE